MGRHSPELIQAEDWSRPTAYTDSATPLFLMHDGGGTTFAYHCLDSLRRFVYGFPNPYFFCGSRFAGGIPEMARLYAGRLREAVSRPDFPARRNADGSVDVLLGGWSLGGILSLEMAHCLASDSVVRVVGILMVDTICPPASSSFSGVMAPRDTSEEGKTKNQILAQRCMTEARRMVGEWEMPRWQTGSHAAKRPKAVLLRATQRVPTSGQGVSFVDTHRDDRVLGWDAYEENMFEHVVNVEGHHFDLFHLNRIASTGNAIRQGLEKLEAAVYPGGERGSDVPRPEEARTRRFLFGNPRWWTKDASRAVPNQLTGS